MENYVLLANPSHINLSPVLFRNTAKDFFKCYLDFKPERNFSPVPYYLCCMAIELGLKAIHVENQTRDYVKRTYNHRLVQSYNDLPKKYQILTVAELDLLRAADDINSPRKEFHFPLPSDAATAYFRYPDLEDLGKIAGKITGSL